MGVKPPQKITGVVLLKEKSLPVQGTSKGLIRILDLILK